jgi:HTH-type transcriptional regulator, transcriptional repressor of NAD biosynthesis genes
MIRGLVIGKFLPVHLGHLALIRFAASKCDELIVSMSARADDPIEPKLRLSWLREILQDNNRIIVRMVVDDFDNESLPWPERTRIWADVIRKTYPPIDILVSSQDYGSYFAANLGSKNILFDPDRTHIPVSATIIRNDPFRYWSFIPDVVKPYFVKKICLYGPESTGKSRMAEDLARKYKTEFVPEVAREFLTTNNFSLGDIEKIGLAHRDRILLKSATANRLLFVDTDAITTKIYSQHYLGKAPAILDQLESEVKYDHYFLFDIDVPWVSDGLRDLENRRAEMLNLFRQNLDSRCIDYTLVSGNWKERETIITKKLHLLYGL